jgi:hypothetical protein
MSPVERALIWLESGGKLRCKVVFLADSHDSLEPIRCGFPSKAQPRTGTGVTCTTS